MGMSARKKEIIKCATYKKWGMNNLALYNIARCLTQDGMKLHVTFFTFKNHHINFFTYLSKAMQY